MPGLEQPTRFLVDDAGQRTAVAVDVRYWQALMDLLEDLEDISLVRVYPESVRMSLLAISPQGPPRRKPGPSQQYSITTQDSHLRGQRGLAPDFRRGGPWGTGAVWPRSPGWLPSDAARTDLGHARWREWALRGRSGAARTAGRACAGAVIGRVRPGGAVRVGGEGAEGWLTRGWAGCRLGGVGSKVLTNSERPTGVTSI
jgi:hypothetical protein